MDLDIANRRVETADEEKRKLIQERDEVWFLFSQPTSVLTPVSTPMGQDNNPPPCRP